MGMRNQGQFGRKKILIRLRFNDRVGEIPFHSREEHIERAVHLGMPHCPLHHVTKYPGITVSALKQPDMMTYE